MTRVVCLSLDDEHCMRAMYETCRCIVFLSGDGLYRTVWMCKNELTEGLLTHSAS